MSEHTLGDCAYSAAGHIVHPIQITLAFNAGPPVTAAIMGEHEHGYVVAPVDDPDHLELWCMHHKHRDTVRTALERGVRELMSYDHSLGKIDGVFISHVPPEQWTECPAPGEVPPWQRPYFTADDVAAWTREHGTRGSEA